ncbi:MAG: hypothetical protein ACTSU4_01685, partial [Promethearchaeota archaeon]
SEGYSGADIKSICEEATIFAIRRGIFDDKIDKKDPSSFKQVKINNSDFTKAFEKIKVSILRAKKIYEDQLKGASEQLYG